jgi:hypothetical protein
MKYMVFLVALVAFSLILFTDAKDITRKGENDLERRLRDLTEYGKSAKCPFLPLR